MIKEANGINYCYCKKEGCNTPERKLSDPENKTDDTFSNLGDSQAAAHVSSSYPSYTRPRYFDDEDLDDGSGVWGDFYYEDYYRGGYVDIEDGPDGGQDYEDMTEPPPFPDLEEPVDDTDVTHKYDRNRHKTHPGQDNTDINFVEEDKNAVDNGRRHGSAATSFSTNPHLMFLMLILLSEVLVGI